MSDIPIDITTSPESSALLSPPSIHSTPPRDLAPASPIPCESPPVLSPPSSADRHDSPTPSSPSSTPPAVPNPAAGQQPPSPADYDPNKLMRPDIIEREFLELELESPEHSSDEDGEEFEKESETLEEWGWPGRALKITLQDDDEVLDLVQIHHKGRLRPLPVQCAPFRTPQPPVATRDNKLPGFKGVVLLQPARVRQLRTRTGMLDTFELSFNHRLERLADRYTIAFLRAARIRVTGLDSFSGMAAVRDLTGELARINSLSPYNHPNIDAITDIDIKAFTVIGEPEDPREYGKLYRKTDEVAYIIFSPWALVNGHADLSSLYLVYYRLRALGLQASFDHGISNPNRDMLIHFKPSSPIGDRELKRLGIDKRKWDCLQPRLKLPNICKWGAAEPIIIDDDDEMEPIVVDDDEDSEHIMTGDGDISIV